MSQPLASFQIGPNIQDLRNTVFHSIPKILLFLLLLVIGWFVATAAIVMVALGVIAALSQVGLATAITKPILYTVLLTCGAIIAIGVGGGLIKPMQARWERMLAASEDETSSQPDARQGQSYTKSFGITRSFGYPLDGHASLRDSARQEEPGQTATDVLDDADYNPGGQYM